MVNTAPDKPYNEDVLSGLFWALRVAHRPEYRSEIVQDAIAPSRI